MRKLLISGLVVACAGASLATSPFYEKDWKPYHSDGTDCTITNFDQKYCGTGTLHLKTGASSSYSATDYVGIYKFLLNSKTTINVLCAELNESIIDKNYESKVVNGIAGYLANQINVVLSTYSYTLNKQALVEHSMALALATWELAYDCIPYGYTYKAGTVNLSSGAFYADNNLTYYTNIYNLGSSSVNVSSTVKALATQYANDALQSQSNYYTLYHAPRYGTTGNNNQDLIGAVPGPAAVLPFLMGFGVALRRRKK